MFLFPISKPWHYTPAGYMAAIFWNISEYCGFALPFASFAFRLIMGKPSKEIQGKD